MHRMERIVSLIERFPTEILEALRELGGYYCCPKDKDGRRLGPLVGYAGKDEKGWQIVGERYYNFAMMECFPFILAHYLGLLAEEELDHIKFDCVCGAPLGGMASATLLGQLIPCRYVFAEKIVTKAAIEGQREESYLKFARHEIFSGEQVAIVEDVVNNFSTTEDLIRLILEAGGKVTAIVALLNRSLKIDTTYQSAAAAADIPVISLVRQPIMQWSQDDPEVAEDIARVGLVAKPKIEWDRLMKAMG